jgi:hypothetical protein
MDFDDLIVARPPTAGASADQPDRHFYEGAVMPAYSMHLLRTEPVLEVRIHPDARQVDFPGWLVKRGFRRVATARTRSPAPSRAPRAAGLWFTRSPD